MHLVAETTTGQMSLFLSGARICGWTVQRLGITTHSIVEILLLVVQGILLLVLFSLDYLPYALPSAPLCSINPVQNVCYSPHRRETACSPKIPIAFSKSSASLFERGPSHSQDHSSSSATGLSGVEETLQRGLLVSLIKTADFAAKLSPPLYDF